MSLRELPDAGYGFIPAVMQYSAGVRALPGFRIERVRFASLVPLQDGFARIAAMLRAAGRKPTALCACELRSPAPFTEDGFRAFNQEYAGVLREWGLLENGANPVARSNVCPEIDPPTQPSFHAFCYTVPEVGSHGTSHAAFSGASAGDAAPSFVVAGSGEVTEGQATYHEHVVAPGDTSADGMRAKARFVLGEMERRMAAVGGSWSSATDVQVYTVFDIHPFLADEVGRRGAAAHGVTWHFARPPIVGLDFEMDCRAVATERVVTG
jgi:hypothetical protein